MGDQAAQTTASFGPWIDSSIVTSGDILPARSEMGVRILFTTNSGFATPNEFATRNWVILAAAPKGGPRNVKTCARSD